MASIDQDKPDTSLEVEFVETDRLILPFTKPSGVPFVVAPKAYVVEDTKKESTIKTLDIGSGLEVDGDTLTMTLEGSDYECYVGRKLYIIMVLINEGRRDAIIQMIVKHAPK